MLFEKQSDSQSEWQEREEKRRKEKKAGGMEMPGGKRKIDGVAVKPAEGTSVPSVIPEEEGRSDMQRPDGQLLLHPWRVCVCVRCNTTCRSPSPDWLVRHAHTVSSVFSSVSIIMQSRSTTIKKKKGFAATRSGWGKMTNCLSQWKRCTLQLWVESRRPDGKDIR